MAAQEPNCQYNQQAPECQTTQALSQSLASTTDLGDTGGGASTILQDSYVAPTTTDAGLTATAFVTSATDASQTVVSTVNRTSDRPSVVTDPPEGAGAEATSKSSSSGVSKGAVAGIAIGTCIIGAAIAFAAAFLLFKRRDRKSVQKTCPSGYPIYADSSPELVMVQKSVATGSPYLQVSQTQMRTPVPVPSRIPVPTQQSTQSNALADILPPAASEHDIRNRAAVLFAQIHRHVDTYYRDVHASITPSMNSDLESFGKDVDMLSLLQNCSRPTVALKHALIAFVLATTGPSRQGSEQTLWPDELTHILKPHSADAAQLATAQALHRRLSVYLYTQAASLAPTNHSQSRLSALSALSLTRKTASAIREAAEHFSLTFFPWADPAFGDQERESELAGIIGEALEWRIWLAGQAAEWGFEWEVPGRGAVVVAPALVGREHGRGPRRVVLDQSVAGI